jgi:hypothetical protein
MAGCSAERFATVECICPPGKPQYHRTFISVPTGQWEFSIHSLWHETVRWYSIRLPQEPAQLARFDALQVQLEEKSVNPPAAIKLKKGYVEINRSKGFVEVAFETESGSFGANGKYDLR